MLWAVAVDFFGGCFREFPSCGDCDPDRYSSLFVVPLLLLYGQAQYMV